MSTHVSTSSKINYNYRTFANAASRVETRIIYDRRSPAEQHDLVSFSHEQIDAHTELYVEESGVSICSRDMRFNKGSDLRSRRVIRVAPLLP
jgi:hypothetical protein